MKIEIYKIFELCGLQSSFFSCKLKTKIKTGGNQCYCFINMGIVQYFITLFISTYCMFTLYYTLLRYKLQKRPVYLEYFKTVKIISCLMKLLCTIKAKQLSGPTILATTNSKVCLAFNTVSFA